MKINFTISSNAVTMDVFRGFAKHTFFVMYFRKSISMEREWYLLLLVTIIPHVNTASDSLKADVKLDNFTQALQRTIRHDREILDERSWDEFPVIPEYFYEVGEDKEEENYRNEYPSDFQPLCQNVRRKIELRNEVYDYHPSHYVETVCRKFTSSSLSELSRNTFNQMCTQPGFKCIQRTRTLFLTRKRFDSDCWESTREMVASGCDCMWPATLSTYTRTR